MPDPSPNLSGIVAAREDADRRQKEAGRAVLLAVWRSKPEELPAAVREAREWLVKAAGEGERLKQTAPARADAGGEQQPS